MSVYVGFEGAIHEVVEGQVAERLCSLLMFSPDVWGGVYVAVNPGFVPHRGSVFDCVARQVDRLQGVPVDSDEVWTVKVSGRAVTVFREHDGGALSAVIRPYGSTF